MFDYYQQRELDDEFSARYDDVYERYADQFGTCPFCGHRSVDPGDCCSYIYDFNDAELYDYCVDMINTHQKPSFLENLKQFNPVIYEAAELSTQQSNDLKG